MGMTDLDKLIAAVEAGLPSPTNWRNFAVLAGEDADGMPFPILAHRAYYGDLNAAHRLHDALLPDAEVDHLVQFQSLGRWEIRLGLGNRCYSAKNKDPARAWLLAILKAVRAKEAGE